MPAATAYADASQNNVVVNSVDTSTSTTLDWTGNGSENATPICQTGQTAQFHWILTPGGNADIVSGSLTVNYTTGSPDTVTGSFMGGSNGAMHFFTQQTVPTTVSSASVNYSYTGDQHNPVLTISDYSCVGTPTPTPAQPTATATALACIDKGSSDGEVSVTVTNTDDQTDAAASYAVTLAGVTKNTGSIADGTSATVNFTGLIAGDYTVSVDGSDNTSTTTDVTVEECATVPTTPTVSAAALACKDGDTSTDATVTVTNNGTSSATYTVSVPGATSQTLTLAAGATGSVTFSGLTKGKHTATVTASDQNTATASFRVKACKTKPVKVFVCKYVGIPGVNERLKRGQNPISVSVKSTGGTAVGSYFNDAHGRSFVLGIDDGTFNPTRADCPASHGPTEVTPAAPTFTPATCDNTSEGSYTIPSTTGVKYKVSLNGGSFTKAKAGTYKVAPGTTVTIKAVAKSGFKLTGTTRWSQTIQGASGCVLGETDVCPNLTGSQATVPNGMTKDLTGNCVTGGLGGGGEVLGASTTAPQLVNTGQNAWVNVIVGLTMIGLTLAIGFGSRKQFKSFENI